MDDDRYGGRSVAGRVARAGTSALGTWTSGGRQSTSSDRLGMPGSISRGGGFTATTSHVAPMGIDPVCYRYINFTAMYFPEERARLPEAITVLSGADPDLITQCAIDMNEDIDKVAAARGVPRSIVRKEFKELLKQAELPRERDINKLKPAQWEPLVAKAYTNLGYQTPEARVWLANNLAARDAGDAVAAAELEESVPADHIRTHFGRLPPWPLSGRTPRWVRTLRRAQAKKQRQSRRAARKISRGGRGRKKISLFGWTP